METQTQTALSVAKEVALEVLPPVRSHHKFGPSRLNYIDECPAFTSSNKTSDAAEEGTFLHEIMEKLITRWKEGKAKTTLEQMGWVKDNYELTDQQEEYIRFCCKKVDALLARKPTHVLVEINVRTVRSNGKELNHGYLDVLFIFTESVAIIIDFKFGWLPVRNAATNLQGFNYALGCFQKFAKLRKIGICFLQPKLGFTSEFVVTRDQIPTLQKRLQDVVDKAIHVQAHPETAHLSMKPGGYCDYCALAGNCVKLANMRGIAAAGIMELPQPPSFKGLTLHRPEDLALAKHWADIVENGLSEVKARAFEAAKANDGRISCTLPSGEEIVYEIQSRKVARSLGSAVEVADALKEICTPEEILGAAELAITKLEAVVKTSMTELAAARGQKLSKKAAWEQASATLEALGLLTQGEGVIEFLKQKKTSNHQLKDKEV